MDAAVVNVTADLDSQAAKERGILGEGNIQPGAVELVEAGS